MLQTAQPAAAPFRPLLERCDLPHIELATLPSPWDDATLDGHAIGIKNDGRCGTLYAGNKLRKLEFLLADARARGFGRVATVGAFGSNHALATATWAQHLGLDCDVLHFPQPPTEHVRKNLEAIARTGAALFPLPSMALLPLALAWWRVRCRVPWRQPTYWIPGGGSSPVGTLGYVNAALELVCQSDESGRPLPERIYVAAGTIGTMAGLIAGLHLAGRSECTVIGVRVVDRVVCNEAEVRRLVRHVLRVVERTARDPDTRRRAKERVAVPWSLRDDQFGPGYGVATTAAEQAVVAAGEQLGLYVETTYTAKVVAAMRADLANGSAGARPVYWHTLNQRPLRNPAALPFDPAGLPRAYASCFADGVR